MELTFHDIGSPEVYEHLDKRLIVLPSVVPVPRTMASRAIGAIPRADGDGRMIRLHNSTHWHSLKFHAPGGQHNNQLRPLLLPSCCFHITFGDLSCHIKIAPSHFEKENARSTSIHYTSPPHSPCFLFCPLFSFLGALLKENSRGEGTTAATVVG